MKEIKLTSLNKMAYFLARGIFKEEDFVLDGDKLILVSTVDEDYLELVDEYKQFEEENRDFLRAFKELKLIRNSLIEKRQEEEIEE